MFRCIRATHAVVPPAPPLNPAPPLAIEADPVVPAAAVEPQGISFAFPSDRGNPVFVQNAGPFAAPLMAFTLALNAFNKTFDETKFQELVRIGKHIL